jgi:hypothetical protein
MLTFFSSFLKRKKKKKLKLSLNSKLSQILIFFNRKKCQKVFTVKKDFFKSQIFSFSFWHLDLNVCDLDLTEMIWKNKLLTKLTFLSAQKYSFFSISFKMQSNSSLILGLKVCLSQTYDYENTYFIIKILDQVKIFIFIVSKRRVC